MPATTSAVREAPHVDEPAAAHPAPRYDIYVNIHKALRLCMAQALAAAGSVDAQDDAEVARVAGEIRAMLALAHAHLEKEETYIHPLMEARRPGSTSRIAADHGEHLHAFERLEACVATLLAARAPAARDAAALALYRAVALFVGENFVHMDAEERDHNAVLWATCTDEEIVMLERRIVGSLPPEESRNVMRWMAPALDPAARSTLFANLRRALPVPAFEGVLALVRSHLSARDRQKLDVALAA